MGTLATRIGGPFGILAVLAMIPALWWAPVGLIGLVMLVAAKSTTSAAVEPRAGGV